MKIILASASPRRKELLDLIKVNYEVIVSDVDEKLNENNSIEEESKKLSLKKAKDVYDKTSRKQDNNFWRYFGFKE